MKKGFTLTEMIVVLSIFTVIAAVSLPLYNYFQSFRILKAAKQEVVQNIRLVKSKAVSGMNNSSYGIYFETDQYTLYQGASYAGRDTSQDILVEYLDNIIMSSAFELNYSKNKGEPSNTGDLVLTNIIDNSTVNITINSVGFAY